MSDDQAQRVITYEAADRGAVCCLGCQQWTLVLIGVALIGWYAYSRVLWALVVGIVLVLAGVGLGRVLRSSRRGRWEISFDRDRRIVTIVSQTRGGTTERVLPFDEIATVELEEIRRDVSTGDDVPYLRPVLHLTSGEIVPLDERMSVKRPDRAQEIAEQMREIIAE